MRESGDWGDQDPAAMMDELDRAIDELSATIANSSDMGEDYMLREPTLDMDNSDRLDTLPEDRAAGRTLSCPVQVLWGALWTWMFTTSRARKAISRITAEHLAA